MKTLFQFTFTEPESESIHQFLLKLKPRHDWERNFALGKIRVNQNYVNKNFILHSGDEIIFDPFHQIAEPTVNPHYQILYEDDVLVAINKPAPLPVHPSGKYFRNSLTEILKREQKNWYTVHRLDSETSGVMILAKQPELIPKISQALKNGTKLYLVLVETTTPPPRRFQHSMILGRVIDGKVFRRRGENKLTGKPSLTYFYRIKTFSNKSLLFAQPITGRTHQIRAHLSSLGYPVFGDKIYGQNEEYFLEFLEKGLTAELLEKLGLPRQFLHAYKLNFIHPTNQKRVIIKSPLPEGLKNLVIQ